jgi:glycerol-3-phosphate O-acyltransferase
MSNPLPHIIPHIKDWPIYKISKQKKRFKEDLKEKIFELLLLKNEGNLKDLIAQCAYSEKNRVKTKPWKVDPSSEKGFWLGISKQLTTGQYCDSDENCKLILKRIISRYVEEIVGGFKIETYLFADKFLSYFFNRLYSSFFAGSFLNVFWKKKMLAKKMHVTGYVEETRDLFSKGTVVLVPTHQSNLDSILIGFYMHLVVGLPAFSYGAGLNLYNVEILAYYMNRLGAYKVDRRKRNAIYHETLFTFLKLSVQEGVNNLFFPAGGRVRDGRIEQNLKMGLLSALIQAQKSNCKEGIDNKIFVVPVTINNHFVLEAKAMINDYLAKTGREKFNRIRKPKSVSYFSMLRYVYNLVSGKSDVLLAFGQPMDVMGNVVDKEGNSLGQKNEIVSLDDYFKVNGVFAPDFQRESIYTKKLAQSIAKSYKTHTVVLSSQLVAFVCFEYLMKKYKPVDIFDLLSKNTNELEFVYDEIIEHTDTLKNHILAQNEAGNVCVDEDIYLPSKELLHTGIIKLGTFHLKRPLKIESDNQIICKDLKLLYYYANRLSGFGFENALNASVHR